MTDDALPVDINYGKLAAWLVDRKFMPPDWRARLAVIQAQAVAAAADLPPELAPADDEALDYARAVAIRDALIAAGPARTLLGGYSGPASLWVKIVRAYEKARADLGEAALALAHGVDFEVPALRRAAARAQAALVDVDRKKGDLARSAAAAAREFKAACAALGVAGNDVDAELAALAATLPAALGAGAAALRSGAVGEAMAYYAAFTAYAHGGEGEAGAARGLLPALAALRDADLEAEAAAAAASAAASSAPAASDEVTEIAWGGDEAAEGGGGGGGGGLCWDVEVTAADDDGAPAAAAAEAPALDWDIGVVADTTADGGGAAAPMQSTLAALADDPSARAALGDDAAELAAFLAARAAAAGAPLPPDCPDAVAGGPAPSVLAAAAADLAAGLDALQGDRARTLLLLRRGGDAAARLAASLKARAGASAKVARLTAQLDERAEGLRAALAADAPKLAAALAAVAGAKAAAEAGVSRLLGGRRVNVVGEVNAVLAAGKA